MFTLCLAVFVFARGGVSAEDGAPLTGWYEPPNERGTWDIIVSCVLTLTICVWSALHLNVPTEESKLAERNYRRVRWIVLGLFAPELVVSTAFGQFLTARWLRGEIRKDIAYRKEHVCQKKSTRHVGIKLTVVGHRCGLVRTTTNARMDYNTMLLRGHGRHPHPN